MPFTSSVKFRAFSMVLALMAVMFTGCSESARAKAKVKGRVKFFDKFLNAGTVTFTSKDGKAVGSSNIDADGNYDMSDAPVGEVTITVKVPQLPKLAKGELPKNVPPKGMPSMAPGGGGGGEAPAMPASFDASKIVQIPGKYGSVDTSGLNYTVEKGGPHTKDITLSP